MCMISCTYLSKQQAYQPCHFNGVDLTVIGSDFDFKDSIVTNGNILGGIYTNMEDKSIALRVRRHFELLSKPFPTKICNCRDTTWAKKQIFSELKRRYPFTFTDSTENYRVYNAYIVDTNKLIRTTAPYGYFELGSNDIYIYRKNYSYYQMIGEVVSIVGGAKENKLYICKIDNERPNEEYNKKYDIYIRKEFYYADYKYEFPDKSLDETLKYVFDSLGFKVELVDEYSKPIKLINFNAN